MSAHLAAEPLRVAYLETAPGIANHEQISQTPLLSLLRLLVGDNSPSKNAGHQQPLANLVVDLYKGVPQPAQV